MAYLYSWVYVRMLSKLHTYILLYGTPLGTLPTYINLKRKLFADNNNVEIMLSIKYGKEREKKLNYNRYITRIRNIYKLKRSLKNLFLKWFIRLQTINFSEFLWQVIRLCTTTGDWPLASRYSALRQLKVVLLPGIS